MKQRSISAFGIVIVSVVPAVLGGAVFALAIAVVMILAFRELATLLSLFDRFSRTLGVMSIAFAAFAAWAASDDRWLPVVLLVSTLVPLASMVFRQGSSFEKSDWSRVVGASLYLVLPTFAAISLRSTEGTVRREWFQDLASLAPGGGRMAEGLGWFFLALFVTWLSDTAAYLVGRSVGRTKLIPRISPNKTVEGAIGGLLAAGITGALCALLFGIHIHPFTGFLFGIVLGAAGLMGDLSESMLKRRAGVKDSGDLIPGHGGVLDRIDALIFVLVATWAFQPLFG